MRDFRDAYVLKMNVSLSVESCSCVFQLHWVNITQSLRVCSHLFIPSFICISERYVQLNCWTCNKWAQATAHWSILENSKENTYSLSFSSVSGCPVEIRVSWTSAVLSNGETFNSTRMWRAEKEYGQECHYLAVFLNVKLT